MCSVQTIVLSTLLLVCGASLRAENPRFFADSVVAKTRPPAVAAPTKSVLAPTIIPSEPLAVPVKKSLGHKLLWYIPSRLHDVVDIMRLRARVGWGSAVSVRATEYISMYGGSYKSVYVGLPGPRRSVGSPWPWGREELKGLSILGVDATDDTDFSPGYSETELSLGLQLVVVGGEGSFDPVELVDFLFGILLFDPAADDY